MQRKRYATNYNYAIFHATTHALESVPKQNLILPLQCFPATFFAALTEQDLGDLSNEFFIEGIEENQPKKRADLIDWDIVFMVFAERLNCFYPFQYVSSVFPSPQGIPGNDFYEMRGQGGGYILLIPEKKGSMVNAFFRFDSIPANIEFTLPQSLWGQVLSIK